MNWRVTESIDGESWYGSARIIHRHARVLTDSATARPLYHVSIGFMVLSPIKIPKVNRNSAAEIIAPIGDPLEK